MIEGVGFPSHMQPTLGLNYCRFLLCKRKDEVLVYQNTNSAYGGYCNSNLLGTEKIELDNLITIYPNPSNGIITIDKRDLKKISSIKIFGVNGKLVNNFKNSINSIDVSTYQKGIYFIVFETEKGTIYKKIIVN